MEVLERINQRMAVALTETRWRDYIQQYSWDHDLMGSYRVTQDDIHYGQSLINAHYLIPEVFQKLHDDAY
ncbi:hypothetical protein ARMGADRAFT_1086985 [Armillaria gallica]|uniref:Uncharacterized protein n=1 Tax=Armillaria gallica TaxID=47427 RepID=A0A2H3CVT0_ARMGA|nr:hypothetical protein ARMGADRAFT_1086985 [Armillaria gallica]